MKHTKQTFFYVLILILTTIPIMVFAQQKQLTKEASEKESRHITVYRRPGCSCCEKWTAYLEKNGFTVKLISSDRLTEIKNQHNIPEKLRSCHTGFIDGYVIEGHVPVESIKKLLENHPDAIGIAVPEMPTGAPGMGSDGTPYEVLLFGKDGAISVYGKY